MRRPAAILLCALAAFPATAAAATDPLRGQQWNLDMVRADAAHAESTGAGAVVAVIDSGVEGAHADLQGRLLLGRDFVDNDSNPEDGNGHGTHVAGIIAAAQGNGVGIGSVAPGARVVPVRVLDDQGAGSFDAVAAGIEWAVRQRVDIINLSLSADVPLVAGDDPRFTNALRSALDAGIVVVAAAGNSALPACENDSAEGRVLCVGAVDRRRTRSYFSSFGSGLALMAPGGAAYGPREEDVLSTHTTPDYEWMAGTSQAAPHVAGVAALLVARGVRGQDAVRRILATASDAGIPGPDPEYGAGIVDARRAVAGLPATPGGPGGDAGGSAAVRVGVRRVQRIRTVRRRGVLVRCRAAGAGRCIATATRRGRRIARGSARLRAGRTTAFRARPTRYGRRLLARSRRVRVRVVVRVPGATPVRRTVTLR